MNQWIKALADQPDIISRLHMREQANIFQQIALYLLYSIFFIHFPNYFP